VCTSRIFPLPKACPRCTTALVTGAVGEAFLDECPSCHGIWVDAQSLEKIVADPELQAALGEPSAASPARSSLATARYVACPSCAQIMNRMNFARISKVIVDVCRAHGTWFDANELAQLSVFLREGGMAKWQKRHEEESAQGRRDAHAANVAAVINGEHASPEIERCRDYSHAADFVMQLAFALFGRR
jgi:Zn-finger nucleic acid-binding protein